MDRTDRPYACARMTLSRRGALKLLAAAGLAITGGNGAAARNGILKRRIPGTSETIPAVGLGTSDAFETAFWESRDPLREVLRRFVAMGGKVIDTAPSYGNAEEVIGELADELNLLDALFMATKVSERGAEAGIEQMEASERLLSTRPLDLIQVHNLIDVETQLATLRRWKEENRVRYIGITHYRVSAFDELERLMGSEQPDFVQLNYSVTTPDAEERLLPLAADLGIAVLVNRPFEDGRLFGMTRGKPLPEWAKEFDCESWAQFSLKYILSNPAVTCAIPATGDPEHLVDNMGGGVGRLPDNGTRRRMREFAASL